MPFHCSICDEPSTRICVRCTKDACDNHICEKCLRCSDCCECEVALNATRRVAPVVHTPPTPEADAATEGEAVAEAEEAEVKDAETGPSFSEEPASDPVPLGEAQTLAPTPPAPDETASPVPEAE